VVVESSGNAILKSYMKCVLLVRIVCEDEPERVRACVHACACACVQLRSYLKEKVAAPV
jgi:hypothetical protein